MYPYLGFEVCVVNFECKKSCTIMRVWKCRQWNSFPRKAKRYWPNNKICLISCTLKRGSKRRKLFWGKKKYLTELHKMLLCHKLSFLYFKSFNTNCFLNRTFTGLCFVIFVFSTVISKYKLVLHKIRFELHTSDVVSNWPANWATT